MRFAPRCVVRLVYSAIVVLATSLAAGADEPVKREITFTPGIEYSHPGEVSLQLDLARPSQSAKPCPAVLCIHGGGFRAGKRERWNDLCKRLAERGYVAATCSYRLAPAHPFPAAVHDVKAAVRWLRANAEKLNLDPQRIGVVGDSAGGCLVQLLGVTGDVASLEGEGGSPGLSSRVSCVVNYYGPSDLTRSYGKSVDAAEVLPLYLGGDAVKEHRRHIEASPLYWATPTAAPTLLLHGTKDAYVAFEQAEWMRDKLKACDVEVELVTLEGAGHGFKGDDAARAEAAMLAFFAQHLKP